MAFPKSFLYFLHRLDIGLLFGERYLPPRPVKETKVARTPLLTLSEETLHLVAGLIVVDEDVEAQALEAFEQLSRVPVRAVAYIHPCRDSGFKITRSFLESGTQRVRIALAVPVFSWKFLLLMMMHLPTRWQLILYWNVGKTIL